MNLGRICEDSGVSCRIALDLRLMMPDRVGVMGEGQSSASSDSEEKGAALPTPDATRTRSAPGSASSGASPEDKPFEPLKVRIKRAPEQGKDAGSVKRKEASSPQPGQVPGADASLGNRIVAAAIDWMIGVGLALGVQLVSLLPAVSFGSAISFLMCAAYIMTRDSLPFLQGQSVGKRAMKIQAVTSEGVSLAGNWKPGMLRNAALLIPLFALVELIVLLTRQDNPKPILRLGDEWAETKVINAGIEVPGVGVAVGPSGEPANLKEGEAGSGDEDPS